MTWFEKLTGFPETSPENVRSNIIIQGEIMRSLVNNASYRCGCLETPSLGELRDRTAALGLTPGSLKVREIVGDAGDLHADSAHAGALFQVASQFNLLEMISPDVCPEDGVGRYENDHTQGPACAVAAGAGTIFRNYFVRVDPQTKAVSTGDTCCVGQSRELQIDCLTDLGRALGNQNGELWVMKNGYALLSRTGLEQITRILQEADEKEIDRLRSLLRVGIQWNTQLTLGGSEHSLSQVYCSALPAAYGASPLELWKDFSILVLEAAYEATILSALINSRKGGSHHLFLTLLGGGVFGNKMEWISGAMLRALRLYRDVDLDVSIVSYGHPKDYVRDIIQSL